MADEKNELDLQLDSDEELSNPEKRIKSLSSKVKTFAQERDAALAAAKEAQEKLAATEREKNFSTGFIDQAIKYPAAKEHQDEIRQKVLAGYTVEDATVSVLNKAGKLNTSADIKRDNAASTAFGGSASTSMPDASKAHKSLGEMTREEKRAALLEMQKRGDFYVS